MVSTEVAAKMAPGESGKMAAMVAVEIAGPAAVGGGERGGGERLETAPGPDAARPVTRIVSLLAAAVACLGLAALLVSGKLVEIAERQPLGETRDWWLGLATDVDRAANFLSLNRPYDLILDVRGVGTDAGRQVDSIEAVAVAAGIDPDAPAVEGAGGEGGGGGAGAADSAPAPPGAPAGPDSSDAPPVVGSSDTGPEGAVDPEGGDPPVADPPEAGPEGAADPEGGDPPVADPPEAGPEGAVGPEGGDPSDVGPAGVDPSATEFAGADPSGPGSTVTGPPDSDPSDRDPSGGEASDTPPAPAGRTVTSEAPLRTYVAGDSQATFLGHALHSGRVRDLLDVTVGDRISTSLARPDYFNWPAEVQKVAETDDPELIVFFLGANDWQDMVSGEGALLRRGTEEWRQEWRWRLFITLEVLKSEHRHVVWVGQPPMRSDPFREGAPVLNEIAREVIAGRDDVTMIDIWEMFGGDGEYREQVIGPDGEEFRARQDDGVHLRREASEWVTDLVVDAVARRWDLQLG